MCGAFWGLVCSWVLALAPTQPLPAISSLEAGSHLAALCLRARKLVRSGAGASALLMRIACLKLLEVRWCGALSLRRHGARVRVDLNRWPWRAGGLVGLEGRHRPGVVGAATHAGLGLMELVVVVCQARRVKRVVNKVSCGRRFGECGALLYTWSSKESAPAHIYPKMTSKLQEP